MAQVSKRIRFEILKRDNFSCIYCGSKAPDVVLHIDHVVPQSLGGSDEPSNLATACQDCNQGKSSSHPDAPTVEEVRATHERWQAAIGQAAVETENQSDEIVDALHRCWPAYYGITPDMEESVRRFHRDGLTVQLMTSAALAALGARHVKGGANKFRYFAAICNGRIRDIQDRALEIMQADR